MGLTDRQSEVLEFIAASTVKHGYPPTHAEIAERFNFRSVNSAAQHIQALVKKGRITLKPGAHRGISVVPV